ncbi:hypothetical protein F5Y10DRAFT_283680 [Nemania abortiva]|nr:hypothetical protein F5Y10DRAFT_283680 [Nemania abortiva]
MYFAKSISTFLVGALLATSALGDLQAPRRAAEDIVKREQKLERARKRQASCMEASKRALLDTRDNILVPPENWASGSGRDELVTVALATCYGIAVVGNGGTGDDRFMSHSLSREETPTVSLLNAVVAAKNNGLSQIRAVFVYPDPNSFDTEEEREDVQEEIEAYMTALDQVVGTGYTKVPHNHMDYYGIKIASNKRITYGSDVHFGR